MSAAIEARETPWLPYVLLQSAPLEHASVAFIFGVRALLNHDDGRDEVMKSAHALLITNDDHVNAHSPIIVPGGFAS